MDYYLVPKYDVRDSFYHKAVVERGRGGIVLKSYGTKVAEIRGGSATVRDTHTSTTLRHVKEFLKQHGFKAETKKQILEDYKARRN